MAVTLWGYLAHKKTPTPYETTAAPYRGTSFIKKSPPPWDHLRTLGIVLMQGLRRRQFLMSEVTL